MTLLFDSADWRTARDEKLREWIGNEHAVRFVLDFSDTCELFDDLIDRDKPLEDGHVVRVLFKVLTEIPVNPFFDQWKAHLVPIIVTGINAWLDANALERGTDHDKVFAFVLRDWYMELVAFVIYAVRGREYMRAVSMDVRRFFTHHETLQDYMEKLS